MNEVIHTTVTGSTQMDLVNYAYTQVYASVGASPVINGTTVLIPAGMSLPILVKTISETDNVFVLGKKKIIAPLQLNG